MEDNLENKLKDNNCNKDDRSIIEKIYGVILDRKANPPEKSYVVSLLKGGIPKISEKIMEEAGEFVEASSEDDRSHTVYEAADLLFHFLVMLGYKDIDPNEVFDELARRFGISGITEKESRNTNK
jgi:phosphoribosyl-ATP pyrophosphohydrolase